MKQNLDKNGRRKSLFVIDSSAQVDPVALVDELTTTLSDVSSWASSAQSWEQTLRAEWTGQAPDGRKYAERYGKPVFPYEGAADTRVRVVDANVSELAQLKLMAFFGGEMRTVAMEANDTDAAGRVNTLLQYELRQRLLAELWDELNFATHWMEAYGHAVLGVFWRREWTTGEATITVEELAALLAERYAAEDAERALAEGQEPMVDEEGLPVVSEEAELDAFTQVETWLMQRGEAGMSELVEMIQELHPTLPEARAKKVVRRLRKEGVDTFRVPVPCPGRPMVRAYIPGFDVFYPWGVDKLEDAPWVAVQDLLWETDLRAKVVEEDWDEDFVNAVLAAGPGPAVDMGSLAAGVTSLTVEEAGRLFGGRAGRTAQDRAAGQDLQFGVLRVYVRGVDEDGVPALHEVVLCPRLGTEPDGSVLTGVNRVVDYYHKGGCFVDLRREWLVRSVWESRGVAELGGIPQMELKTRRDSHMDRVALNTLPPVTGEARRMPGLSERYEGAGIKPGGFVPMRNANERAEFMRLPSYEPNDVVERLIQRDQANLLGLVSPDLPQEKLMLHRQWLVNGYLIQIRGVVLRILAMDQQFMEPLQVSRIIGTGEVPFAVTREEIAGQYDVMLTFDVRSMDMEWMKEKLAVLKEAMMFDKSGAFRDVPVMRYIVSQVDPNLADLAIADAESAREMEADDEKRAIGTLLAGVDVRPPDRSNAAVRLETIRQELANNPVVNARYQQDDLFRRRLERRMGKWEFDLQQRENARTGASGWVDEEG